MAADSDKVPEFAARGGEFNYVLLFPFGTSGWTYGMPKSDRTNAVQDKLFTQVWGD